MFKPGTKNPNWNGGTSEYPNHNLMKKNRLIRLKQAACKCEVCGEKAKYVHHIDEDKSNHALDNLAVLCKDCHFVLHADRKNPITTSKYKRIYGMTIVDMIEKFGGCFERYKAMHKRGTLKIFLDRGIVTSNSKYFRLYGMNAKDIMGKFSLNYYKMYSMHRTGTLSDYIRKHSLN